MTYIRMYSGAAGYRFFKFSYFVLHSKQLLIWAFQFLTSVYKDSFYLAGYPAFLIPGSPACHMMYPVGYRIQKSPNIQGIPVVQKVHFSHTQFYTIQTQILGESEGMPDHCTFCCISLSSKTLKTSLKILLLLNFKIFRYFQVSWDTHKIHKIYR